MRYLLQRIVHNDLGWKEPSSGRLGSSTDGGYLKKTGFAHEDWNFDDNARGGFTYGYSYFKPKDLSSKFSIAFATYDPGGRWHLAGCYEDVSFSADGAPFSSALLNRRAKQLKILQDKGELGGDYSKGGVEKLAANLKDEAQWYRWKVPSSRVVGLPYPIPIPIKVLPKTVSLYFARPADISDVEFVALRKLTSPIENIDPQDDYESGGDVEFPEGRAQQGLHLKRERSRKLIVLTKARFKLKHGRLFCEACQFDFSRTYGQPGVDFIEVHHTIPVSLLNPDAKTKVSDMAVVCSNCHRMLHRRRPWLSISQLRRLIVEKARMTS